MSSGVTLFSDFAQIIHAFIQAAHTGELLKQVLATTREEVITTIKTMTQEHLESKIKAQLESFGSLAGKYVYGEALVEANGGYHIDSGL